ncbi:MAG: methyltransferase, partial [Clostridia bacterium]|nr:methyltransferase [Clostridia bacterium]
MELKQAVFCCPVCKDVLFICPDGWRCFRGHHFDKAKQGYVNLLRSNSSSGHGDDKLMVASRSDFLNKGFYAPLRDAIAAHIGKGHTVLDAGCGEGYYTVS